MYVVGEGIEKKSTTSQQKLLRRWLLASSNESGPEGPFF
jgi:hypothetical protein